MKFPTFIVTLITTLKSHQKSSKSKAPFALILIIPVNKPENPISSILIPRNVRFKKPIRPNTSERKLKLMPSRIGFSSSSKIMKPRHFRTKKKSRQSKLHDLVAKAV